MKSTNEEEGKGVVCDNSTILSARERGASDVAGVSLHCGWQQKLLEHTASFQTDGTEDFRKRHNTHSYLKNV